MPSITPEIKRELIAKYGKSETDTGSTEVQIAMLTHRINHLQSHFKTHAKDFAGRRGLLKLVGQRRNFLNYLRNQDIERYRNLIKELGLRK